MNAELDLLRINLEGKINGLIDSLDSPNSNIGDWKVIKCYEAKLLDKGMPYDLNKLMQARQEVRDEINSLQEQLEEVRKVCHEG